jgi:hypothetical protein
MPRRTDHPEVADVAVEHRRGDGQRDPVAPVQRHQLHVRADAVDPPDPTMVRTST